jgi:hypothetical protein
MFVTIAFYSDCAPVRGSEKVSTWTSGRIQTERYGFTLHEPHVDFLHGFSDRLELTRAPKQEHLCFCSPFSCRITYCLTLRYVEPYISAQMRPLVLIR